jgi:hypothetical protein
MLPSIAHSPVNGNIEETKISIDYKLRLDLQSSRKVCTCGLHVLGLVTIVANKQYLLCFNHSNDIFFSLKNKLLCIAGKLIFFNYK